jgi:biopolymer transport protein ExbB
VLLGFSEDRRRVELAETEKLLESQERLQSLQKELERVQVKRWQDKRNAVLKKENFKELWDELQLEQDRLERQGQQKRETLLRLNGQRTEWDGKISELKQRRKDFGIQVSDKLREWEGSARYGFPEGRQKMVATAKSLQEQLEAEQYNVSINHFQEAFTLRHQEYQLGRTWDIQRTSLPLAGVGADENVGFESAQPKLQTGWMIRLGVVYKAFISTESSAGAILVKTGKLSERSWDWLEDLKSSTRDELFQVRSELVASQNKEQQPLFLPMDVLLRKGTGEGYRAGQEFTFFKKLGEELKGVGFVIYLLLPLMGFGLVLVIYKGYIFYTRGRGGAKFAKTVLKLVEEDKHYQALEYCKKYQGSLPRVLTTILNRKHLSREQIENLVYEIMLHETTVIEKNIGTVNILAAAAPLMGLLGTVSGMVNLFSAITLHGTSDPKIMAAGIAEALLSTKWGLLAAIPLLLIYNWMNNRSQKITSDMEKYSTRLINNLFAAPEKEPVDVMSSLHKDELNPPEAPSS